MVDEPGVDPGDVLTVLIESFDYYILNMTGNGIMLAKGRHSLPVLIPFGVSSIPKIVVERLLATCDFALDDFWTALSEFQQADEE